MVEDVEHFSSELQCKRLMYWEVAVNRQVPLGGTESSQGISPQVPLPRRIPRGGINRWVREGGWIKRFPTSVLRPEQIERLPRKQIRSDICRNAVYKCQERCRVRNVDGWR